MPDSFDYTTGTNSENVRLLQALIDDAPEYTEETNSRNANILKSIINNTEYTDAPQSEIEELLLRLKAKIGGEIEVDELNVTENGTYDAGVNKAYNPVKVELPLDSKTITENGTYTASDDNLEGYDEVTVAVEGYAKKSIANTPTAIATFNASALPMPSLTVGIEAVQDLHGYDSPWVGGAGKNKLPMTVEGIKAVNTYHSWSGNSTTINNVTITIETSNSGDVTGIRFNGTASADITFNLATNISIPNGEYKLSNDQIVNVSNLWLSLSNPNIAITLNTEKEKSITISNGSIGSAYIYASSGNAFNNVVFKPMIRLATVSDATFEPYSNICPISGWDEANVTRCGKNFYDFSKSVDAGGGTRNLTINLPRNTDFVISLDTTVQGMYIKGSNDGFVTQTDIKSAYGVSSTTFNSGNYKSYLISLYKNGGVSESDNIKLELGTTPTTYEPYNGTTYTTTLKDGQGNPLTCYGGTLSNENGVQSLVLTHGYIASYNGETLPSTWISDRDVYAEGTTPTTGAEVVYELATPQTIPQDNLAIATQEGTNNIWADTGDIQSGEYLEAL